MLDPEIRAQGYDEPIGCAQVQKKLFGFHRSSESKCSCKFYFDASVEMNKAP
jgi:hypothetical protein